MLNLAYINFSNPGDAISGVMAIFIAIGLFSIPFALVYFLISRQNELPNFETIIKVEGTYNEQRVEEIPSLLFNVFWIS